MHNIKKIRKYDFHTITVLPYLRRKRIKGDTLVFIYTTSDDYMKRAFLRRGWIENPVTDSRRFDLRWDLNENSVKGYINL